MSQENSNPCPNCGDGKSIQAIIHSVIGQLRHSNNLSSIIQSALEAVTKLIGADRGIVWQVVGDHLETTNEYSLDGHICFLNNRLGANQSTAIVLEFLSQFPPGHEGGLAISVSDTQRETKLHEVSPMLRSLIELGNVRSRLMVQLRSRGIFSGIVEMQQCGKSRVWTNEESLLLQRFADVLSIVVQQDFDRSKIERDARSMKLISDIADLARNPESATSQETLLKSMSLLAEHMGFVHSQIYLFNKQGNILKPQLEDGGSTDPIELTKTDDPFVRAFSSGNGLAINAEYTKAGDPRFGHAIALITPLTFRSERLGVMGVWEKQTDQPSLHPQDRELALAVGTLVAPLLKFE